MKKIKILTSSIWSNLYLKPMAWLGGLPTDKVLHFGVSMVLAQMFFFLSASSLFAFAVTVFVGIFKEVVIDKLINKEEVEVKDLLADSLGIFAGLILLEIYGFIIDIHNYVF